MLEVVVHGDGEPAGAVVEAALEGVRPNWNARIGAPWARSRLMTAQDSSRLASSTITTSYVRPSSWNTAARRPTNSSRLASAL
jgi:hypothetical protein